MEHFLYYKAAQDDSGAKTYPYLMGVGFLFLW